MGTLQKTDEKKSLYKSCARIGLQSNQAKLEQEKQNGSCALSDMLGKSKIGLGVGWKAQEEKAGRQAGRGMLTYVYTQIKKRECLLIGKKLKVAQERICNCSTALAHG